MQSADRNRIAIVLVNYMGADNTIDCLDSILRLETPSTDNSISVLVVENGSTDDSSEKLTQWVERGRPVTAAQGELVAEFEGSHGLIQVSLLHANRNGGFAAGCNLGLARARTDASVTHFWLLNNDTIVDPAAAKHLLVCSKDHSDHGICGSTLLYHDDPEVVQAAGGARYLRLIGRSRHVFKRRPVSEIRAASAPGFDYIVGASMFFSREVLEAVGYLPERYFLYAEETDWCTRARLLGISLGWARASYVFHKEGSSTGAEARFKKVGDTSFYFISRNNLLYVWKYFKHFTPTAILYCLVEASLYAIKGDRGKLKIACRAIRDFWVQRARATSI